MRDRTLELRELHQSFQKQMKSREEKENNKKKEDKQQQPLFDAALRTVDSSVRDACSEARKALLPVVRANTDFSIFSQSKKKKKSSAAKTRKTFSPSSSSSFSFHASTHQILTPEMSLALELADSRLVAACAAAKQLGAAVARAATATGISQLHNIVVSSSASSSESSTSSSSSSDRLDILLSDFFSNFPPENSSTSTSSQKSANKKQSSQQEKENEQHTLTICYAAASVQACSKLASDFRVVLALVRDEAERTRVQRLRFAKCGVLVNPADHIADAAPSTSSLVLLKQRVEERKSASATTSSATAEATRNETSISSSSSSSGSLSSTGLSSGFSKLTSAFTSTTQTVKGVAFGVTNQVASTVTRIATETTNSLVGAIAEQPGSSSSSRFPRNNSSSNSLASRAYDTSAIMNSATSQRKLVETAAEMSAKGEELKWRKILNNNNTNKNSFSENQQNQNYHSHQNEQEEEEGGTGEDSEVVSGLQREHASLTSKLKDESVQQAREMERSIAELGRLTTILQEQVSLQSEQLIVIEKNTDESEQNLDKAQDELEKHDTSAFWSFKRIVAVIVWIQIVFLLVMHFLIR